ncbi:uncharacterized protein (DUF697 family) [Actinoplanes campanulatus]|uniref:Uncharacterized protein (DUF697 family) n=1 Tax=Actinoplanes campanulatus TaxID=113559 RepID=A0A7W5FC25_9ACTN|nr:hypothetical protein [Actinoplanes campanulatus]MBB3092963.1 uncharacterized protein (DUF697 family) [Actinoplanes campanulatus]GGN00238.1 hypothetical protein GCM10010109_05250 [Actinoplanes campanulatus]GID33941.1 hypothetical protein Aca09nite_04470 [Actinoplanes campanulatus]
MSHPDRATEPGAEIEPVAPRAPEEVGRTVAALTADDLEQGGRSRLLGRLAGQLRGRGIGRVFRPKAALRWVADTVAELAPHVPVRDRETLRRHFPGMDDGELAERLIRNAARATAGVGAAGGGIASVEWVAAPTLLSVPVLLATETVAVVAIEIKLIGELHELYGRPITGDVGERALRLIEAWSGQRGVNPMVPGVGVATVLSTASRSELQKSLMKRFGRNLTTLGPMLTGAVVASYLNRRATRVVGDKVHDDLRRKALRTPPARPALGR